MVRVRVLGELALEELTTQLADVLRARGELWYLQWTLLESAFAPTAHGRFDEGARRLDEALRISDQLGDPPARGLIGNARGWLERSRGNYARALELGDEAVAVTGAAPSQIWLDWAASTSSLALADLRAWPEAPQAPRARCFHGGSDGRARAELRRSGRVGMGAATDG